MLACQAQVLTQGFFISGCDCVGEGKDQRHNQRANWGEDAEEWRKRAVKLAPLHRAADGSFEP